jgi:hypothetical protein
MKFNKNGMHTSVWSGKSVYTKGVSKRLKDSDRVREHSFEGMQKRICNTYGLSRFSYYDPEKGICKLCYEEIISTGSKERGYIMINKLDGKLHRVYIGRTYYCKMARKQ